MLAVATTEPELSRLEARLSEFGLRSFIVAEPSRSRRVALATFVDGAATARIAATLRIEGLMAVTRPDGGAALSAWLRDTRPVTVRARLTVCLAWSEHDRTDLPGLLEIGPGGFGSGHHPTTLMLLEGLADRIEGGERVLDVGCGSGVLGLGALRLGAAAGLGIDLKPEAVEAARRNAELNGMMERFDASASPLEQIADRFDTVVANVARAGIVSLAPQLLARLAPGGWLAVSGITPGQCEQVGAFLRPLEEEGRRVEGDWASLVFS